MRNTAWTRLVTVAAVAGFAACSNPTAPATQGDVVSQMADTTAPAFTARVVSVTHEAGNSPDGPIDQYALFVDVSGDGLADAGVIVPADQQVYVRGTDGTLRQLTASQIRAGQRIAVWRQSAVVWGSVQSPPNTPCYTATQVLIEL
jgi:hypothetical protein